MTTTQYSKPLLHMEGIDSGNVKAVAYDCDACVLYVTFKSGTAYSYVGVPELLVRQFMHSPSKGGFLAANIRAKYSAQLMTAEACEDLGARVAASIKDEAKVQASTTPKGNGSGSPS